MSAPEGVDPFDLPDWLGDGEVTWSSTSGLREAQLVEGALVAASGADSLPCDLFAVDVAYPRPVVDDPTRILAHQAWCHGQIHLASRGQRLTLMVPGTSFTADRALDALGRLARAVGARPERYAVVLRIGDTA